MIRTFVAFQLYWLIYKDPNKWISEKPIQHHIACVV